jgi:hypothetical protein
VGLVHAPIVAVVLILSSCPIIFQPNVVVVVGGNLTCGEANIVAVLVLPNEIWGIQVSEIVLHNFLVLASWSSMLLTVVVLWVWWEEESGGF